jgi:hypothetical protein
MTPETYDAFRSAVELHLAGRGLTATVKDGVAALALRGGRPLQSSLRNLAQQWLAADPAARDRLVAEHFSALLRAERAARDAGGRPHAEVADRLRLRLYPESDVGREGAPPWIARPVAPGLVAVLVLDLPDAVMAVDPEDTTGWPGDADAWIASARAALASEGGFRTETVPVERGVSLSAIHGESFLVASQLLVLERHLPRHTPYGVIASAPTRHLLLLHVIEDARVLLAVNALIPLAFAHFAKGPGGISPRVFWWREGAFVHLPTEVSREGVTFSPPPEFVERVMKPLGK